MISTAQLLSQANNQQQLFDYSPLVTDFDELPNQDFITNGYVLLSGIPNADDAVLTSYRIIKSLATANLFYSDYVNQIQLSKADQIPVCESFIGTGFQALHFDYGLPLLPLDETLSNTFEMIVALYYPLDATELSNARTRVVSLEQLPQLTRQPSKTAENRIKAYVKNYGDGWTKPEVYNSHRISIFARVIDACSGTTEFAHKLEEHSQNFFQPSTSTLDASYEEQQLAAERDYFSASGIDLSTIEKQICLKPGDLLLIDNMRAVHGRIGNRKPKEVWQFLFGCRNTPFSLIDKTRNYLAACMGK